MDVIVMVVSSACPFSFAFWSSSYQASSILHWEDGWHMQVLPDPISGFMIFNCML